MSRQDAEILSCILFFFQVSSIYKDHSIGNLINIVIVKLVIMNNELVSLVASTTICISVSIRGDRFLCVFWHVSQDGPVISFNAQTTLKNFCIWQQSQNVLDDNHHSHHDTAILITRCRGTVQTPSPLEHFERAFKSLKDQNYPVNKRTSA